MALDVEPPAQIDIAQSKQDQIAFINKNFQSIANVIGNNAFKIIVAGTFSITAAANTSASFTLTHNLGFIPVPFAFLSSAGNTTYTPLPTWVNLTRDDANAQIVFANWIDCTATATTFNVRFFNAFGSSRGPFNIRYYLLQENIT